jgi:hypothetical protein
MPAENNNPTGATPTLRDRHLLTLWCVATFVPSVGLFLYLPASTQPRLEHFSEEPHLFTAFMSLCLLLSMGLLLKAKSDAFVPALKRRMRLGSGAGLVFFMCYSTYVYSFSKLPAAPDAPELGAIAPDFSVRDPDGRTWTLSEMSGDVLVFFYRGHW